METIYREIAMRTDGDIYIGIVGPVRTGKSTLIKRLMETLVIPNINEPYRAERARDELPQSGSGKTIMTSEPKFVPEEAVDISPDGISRLRIRMIDSVGYMVDGAVGVQEDGKERMVSTPWYDHEIPISKAAELGTKKVMQEHCTIGLVVTTDGSITDIPRQDYIQAENKAIADMAETGKPFLVIVNSANPSGEAAKQVCRSIKAAHGITPYLTDCQSIQEKDIQQMLQELLYTFPMGQLHIHMPHWLDVLESDHPVKTQVFQALLEKATRIKTLGDAREILLEMQELDSLQEVSVPNVDLGSGIVVCSLCFPQSLFYEIISSKTGIPIQTDGELLRTLTELSQIRQEYEKISDALASVKATGYGIVMPSADEMVLKTPEVVRKGGAFGVKLKAGAPSIHMIRVDIDTEISPMVGGEQQSQDLINYLSNEEPDNLWQSNIFGKSVYTLIQEGLSAKLIRTPDEVREKFRNSLTRIVNEGATGLICLIL